MSDRHPSNVRFVHDCVVDEADVDTTVSRYHVIADKVPGGLLTWERERRVWRMTWLWDMRTEYFPTLSEAQESVRACIERRYDRQRRGSEMTR